MALYRQVLGLVSRFWAISRLILALFVPIYGHFKHFLPILDQLRRVLGHFRTVQGLLRCVLGHLGLFGVCLAGLGPFLTCLGPFMSNFGSFKISFGPFAPVLGLCWVGFRLLAYFGHFRPVLDHLWPIFGVRPCSWTISGPY